MRSTPPYRPVPRLVVIAKECLPGRVKTRLTPPLDPRQAADLAAASLERTLDVVRSVDALERILLFQGDPQGLDLTGFQVVPQTSGSLDQRIAAIFDASPDGAVLVGMDTPQLSAAVLQQVIDDAAADSWLGPAEDGGFWALGLRSPRGDLIRGVPMSTPRTGSVQLARLHDAGLRPRMLPRLRDVDSMEDALQVATQIPDSDFARLVRASLAGCVD